jgi:hypothetical protein
MPYDLFISYSRRDNDIGRISEFVDRIKRNFSKFNARDLNVFFDRQEIHGMEDWKHKILRGLRESRLLLACLSPSYLKSQYCEWELVEYFKFEIGYLYGFSGVAPVYFVEVPGWTDAKFDQNCAAWISELRRRQHFDLRPWYGQGEAALHEAAIRERMGELDTCIVKSIERRERAQRCPGNVDAHNNHFVGRTDSLRDLRENFIKPGTVGTLVVISGLGGVGKTALAIEYAHAFADEYGGGCWQIRCAGQTDLRVALTQLATTVGFSFEKDEAADPNLSFERILRELRCWTESRSPARCLLILDNIEVSTVLEPGIVSRLNCQDWIHIIATSRFGENQLYGSHRDRAFLPMDELSPDDAMALMESYQPARQFRNQAERAAAIEIVKLLGGFPLAVESAAVFLGGNDGEVTCAGFLERLRNEGVEGLDAASSQSAEAILHGEKRVAATIKPTLGLLDPAERTAIEYAALFFPDQIPVDWLRALVCDSISEVGRDADPGYPDPWRRALRRLLSFRLVRPTADVDDAGRPMALCMHRLLQEIIKADLKSKTTNSGGRNHLQVYLDGMSAFFRYLMRGQVSGAGWETANLVLEDCKWSYSLCSNLTSGIWANSNGISGMMEEARLCEIAVDERAVRSLEDELRLIEHQLLMTLKAHEMDKDKVTGCLDAYERLLKAFWMYGLSGWGAAELGIKNFDQLIASLIEFLSRNRELRWSRSSLDAWALNVEGMMEEARYLASKDWGGEFRTAISQMVCDVEKD